MKRVPAQQALTLSAEEIDIVMAYRDMDARGKRENLTRMQKDARDYPHRARPTFHLIVGGAK